MNSFHSIEGHCFPKLFHNAGRLATSATFEAGFCLLIILNALVMALEAQHRGIETGRKLGYNGATTSTHDAWLGAIKVFEVMEWIFGVLFTIELVLKLTGMGFKF